MNSRTHERGSVDGWMLGAIGLIIALIAVGAFAIWSYNNYKAQKTDVDNKIALATAAAKKSQADSDEAKFAERDKEPNRQFVGPDDYGRLTFDYPKTWSVYIAQAASEGSTYTAYLNPVSVPMVDDSTRVALRVTIENRDYDTVLSDYQQLVQQGQLTSSAVSVNGSNGTRLDGNFTQDIRGSAVIYKIRDKTLTIRTDADTFKPDFDKLIQTIKFNQ